MYIQYKAPAGVHPLYRGRQILLTTAQSGQVLVDAKLLGLWEKACQGDLNSLLNVQSTLGYREMELRTALACLCQAGLLERNSAQRVPVSQPTMKGPLVSVIIVSYNSRPWLEDCLASLTEQSYQPLETILVDNHSSDDTATWLSANYPKLHLLRLSKTESLAQAINTGVEAAQGTYFLILNPDVRLEPNAVAELGKSGSCGLLGFSMAWVTT